MLPAMCISILLISASFSQQSNAGQGRIVFPDEERAGAPAPMKPKCIRTDGHFCSEVENYPKKILERVLKAEKYTQMFGDDLLPGENMTRRFDYDVQPLCECRERVIYPQAGITRSNSWSIIINQEKYTQGIRVEECVNPGKSCHMSSLFPLGVRTECKQKYIYRQLLSLNPKGVIVKEFFRLPSCCMCTLHIDRD